MATRGVPQPGDVCALIAIAVQEVESGALVMSDSCVRWCGKVRASLIIQVLIYKQFDLFLRRLYVCPSPVSRLPSPVSAFCSALMARRRSIRPPEEDFPMTPMIDMVFLLLVFFMTVSTLAQADRRLELDLPESVSSDVPESLSDRGTISLDAAGRVYLGAQEQTLELMRAKIKQSLEDRPNLRIHVRADRATPYSEIKKVLRACAEVGAYDVIYATYQAR